METLRKKALFWDIDLDSLDPEQNKRFVIERILGRGDVDDVRWARERYGDEALKETLLLSRTLDRKSLSFWCSYFDLDTSLCIPKPSLLKRAAFWNR
jgi:hypothetical protein